MADESRTGEYEPNRQLLATMVYAAYALRDATETRQLYPSVLPDRMRELHKELTGSIEAVLQCEGFERFLEEYERPDLDDHDACMEVFTLLGCGGIFNHPEYQARFDPDDVEATRAATEAAFRACERECLPEVRKAAERTMEIQVRNCLWPHPQNGISYRQPARVLFMLQKYWGLCVEIVEVFSTAYVRWSVPPVLPLVVDLESRFREGFRLLNEEEAQLEGITDAQEAIDGLLEMMQGPETDVFQAVPEYKESLLSQVSIFIERGIRLYGGGTFELTRAEENFLKSANQGVACFRNDVNSANQKFEEYLARLRLRPTGSIFCT